MGFGPGGVHLDHHPLPQHQGPSLVSGSAVDLEACSFLGLVPAFQLTPSGHSGTWGDSAALTQGKHCNPRETSVWVARPLGSSTGSCPTDTPSGLHSPQEKLQSTGSGRRHRHPDTRRRARHGLYLDVLRAQRIVQER